QPAAQPAPALRRRPRQSRAQATSDALQQAFVQLLLERGYAKATIREIALVDLQLDAIGADAALWSALFALERQVSQLVAYRRHYDAYVALWRDALAQAADPPPAERLDGLARMAHTVCYGGVSQALLTLGPALDFGALRGELHTLLGAYL
ncbi:TetR/AcrR family transcriptional regulator, partial [Burkholderia gladioli]|uniref:TetR/AcrR family transcriptional regulator n=1 Tax=Burkholderia gladioli TaxID=28095 RepID=UPI001FC82593